MKAARGLLLAVPGDCCACFSLSLVETMAASVVLPNSGQPVRELGLCMYVPDPGIPDTAINNRFEAGTS
jgi:hypothetical protein